jgi:hypothetical protein
MASKKQTGKKAPAVRRAKAATVNRANESQVLNKVKDLYDNPAVRYIAGGVALAALGKFMNAFSERYPEITNVIKDGLDTVEHKLTEFKESDNVVSQDIQH